ncbi:hypothetical protein [Streptomyces boninensis]|uniref:hypothetical protein n=1 Tax=Streptomyces boninensis TaxID=2039455 RepID=UPI003B215903
MNQETEVLLLDVVERLQRAILARDCPAVVALQGEETLVMSEYDYLRDADTGSAFERRAAGEGRRIAATRFVFALPQVWLPDDEGVQARAVANLPLREGEDEVVSWMSYAVDDGVDYGFVPYVRQGDGRPDFGRPTMLTTPLQPGDATPGRELLRIVLEGRELT